MKPENKQRVHQLIGALAFVVGGLLARASAIENTERLEKMWKRKGAELEDPRTPPTPAQVPDEPSL